jgi:hypothetical protein
MARHKVTKIAPAPSDLLIKHALEYDYIETWAITMVPGDSATSVEWAHAIFYDMPALMRILFKLRHVLVKAFGLKTEVPGLPYTGFPLLDKDGDNIILWLEDKHLTFWVTVDMETKERVLLSIAVKMHNGFGRIYLVVIRLFQPLLMRYGICPLPCPLSTR